MKKRYNIFLLVLLIVLMLSPQVAAGEISSAGVVVLVSSKSENRFDFDRYLKLYLDYFDVAYTVINVAEQRLPENFDRAALLIIGHEGVFADMDLNDQKSIERYISEGSGVFSFDMALKASQSKRILQRILNLKIGESVTAQGGTPIKAEDTNHYITAYKADRPDLQTVPARRIGLTVPNIIGISADTKTLMSIADVPLVIVGRYGQGRIVQWTTYGWLDANVLGFYNGLDDIVWRSLVWAARKPFVFQGNIPLVSMRIDDCIGLGMDYEYIDVINKYDIIPHIAFMMDDMPPSAAKKLGEYTRAGKAEAFVHSRVMGNTNFMYWDFDQGNFYRGRPLTEEKLKKNFADLDAFHKNYGIKYAQTTVAHWGAIGVNVLTYLRKLGVEFIQSLIWIYPNTTMEWKNIYPWPYQLYQRAGYYQSTFGSAGTGSYVYNSSIMMDWIDEDPSFFSTNVQTQRTKYDWLRASRAPGYERTRKVKGMIIDGINIMRLNLDSMGPAFFFTHEVNIGQLEGKLDGLDRAFAGVIANLKKFHNIIPCGLDHLCQYGKNIRTADLESAYYDSEAKKLTVHWNGFSDILTKFHVFTEVDGTIVDNLHDLPIYRGPTVAEVNL